MSAADVDEAVKAARRCLESGWSQTSAVHERADALRAIASEIRTRKGELSELEARDCGKTIHETSSDLSFCCDVLEYFADLAPRALLDQPIAVPDHSLTSRSRPEPAGVVGCVTPWNYPLMQAVAKVAPAVACGCSALLKPSPLASLTCIELGKMADRHGFPPGALAVITGGPPGGVADGAQRLVEHEHVDLLSFTGSERAGRQLLFESARRLRRSTLELGGKGALLVFDDADVSAAVDWAMVGIVCASGQMCSATSR